MQTVANAMVADLYPARQRVMVNAAQIAFGCGAMCGPFAAARLMAAGADWRALYAGLAAVIACLFMVTLLAPSMPGATRRNMIDPAMLKAILRQPAFQNLCLVAALYAGAEVGFFQWMPSYFHHRIVGGDRWAGAIVTIFWTGMTLGRIGSGSLITRFPLRTLRAALSATGALAAIAALAFASPAPTAICVLLTGVCFGGIFSLILAEAAQRYSQAIGTAFGIVVAISGVGTAIIPWAIGTIAGTPLDWRGGLGLVPLCAFAVSVNTIWTSRAQRVQD
jgi:fucose permease